jgi:ABC-type lipoprotein release transport system permease subunit
VNVTWRLAWRNLWRHSRRTWLTVGAMVFSNMLLVFLISLQLGSYTMMIDNTLNAFTGHVQIQHAQYLEGQKMRQSVPDVQDLAARARTQDGVVAAAGRALAFALASSEERSFGIQISGVEPAFEPGVSSFPGLISAGRYLTPDSQDEIVIGKVLAENLKVGLGDELTFLGSGRDDSFAAAVATVVGIVETGFDEADRGVAQVSLVWFQQVFAMGDHGHAVVIRAQNLDAVPMVLDEMAALVADRDELAVRDWDALQPGLRQAITSDMTSAWFMYAVLIVLVAFSVLNTQLMSVLERTREFGVMLALGMSPGKLARLVGIETLLMSCLGLGLGVMVGAALASYLSVVGFYYPGMEEMAARFNLPARMYPQVSVLSLLWGPVTVFVFALLAAIYPALRLYQLQPVAAMRAV